MTRRLTDRLVQAAGNPKAAAASLLVKMGIRKPPTADSIESGREQLRRYGALARRAGLDRLYLFLSFDCDTDEDVQAAADLEPRLREAGIRATYAVPGVQLRRGAAVYRRLANNGATFMNHGGRPHAEWHEDIYRSVTFYDQLSEKQVIADMEEGHRVVDEIIGRPPTGFRAPHFGCFQKDAQIALIHGTAARLGYRYCSTTIPNFALMHGPIFESAHARNVFEIPVFGSARYPTTVLDSWTYLTDRRDYKLSNEYAELFDETVNFMLAEDVPGVLSYYADPSHVAGQAAFDQWLDVISRSGLTSVTGDDLVDRFTSRLAVS